MLSCARRRMKHNYTIHTDIYRCLIFYLNKVAKFGLKKTRRQSKRLFTICPPPFHGRQGKDMKLYPNNCKYFGKNFSFVTVLLFTSTIYFRSSLKRQTD